MTDTARTLTYAGVAAVLGLGALLTSQGTSPAEIDGFSDVGKVLFDGFDDPAEATTLEVVGWNEEEKAPQVFGVQQKDEKWVLSSHNDYPAEAADRLARTAASLIGIERSAVKSRREDDWSEFGVLDPSDEDSALSIASADEDSDEAEEEQAPKYGTRITLRDSDTNALVDLIIGNEVPDQSGYRYVRVPGEKTTFISKLNIDLSAKFEDWIEEDLLQVEENKIVQVKVNNYSIDEAGRALLQGDIVEAQKKNLDTTADWTLIGIDEDKEEFDNSPIASITSNLSSLKIKGVRRKSKGINPDLTLDPTVSQDQFTMLRLQSELQAQGYFVVPDKDGKVMLASNEGELIAGTEDGVKYTLYFGEVATGSSRDIEVGQLKSADDSEASEAESKEEEAGDKETADEKEPEPETGSRRYVLIKVEFDESLLGSALVEPTEPEKPAILKEAEAAQKKAEASKSSDNPESSKEVSEPSDTKQQEDSDTTENEPVKEKPENDCSFQEEDESQEDNKKVEKSSTDDAATDTSPTEEASADEDKKPEQTPEQLAKIAYDTAMATYLEDKRAYDSDVAARNRKRTEGQEQVEQLKKRFADWYYVITANDFEKFRIDRTAVVSEKQSEDGDSTKTDEK